LTHVDRDDARRPTVQICSLYAVSVGFDSGLNVPGVCAVFPSSFLFSLSLSLSAAAERDVAVSRRRRFDQLTSYLGPRF
jgi:hypothetical protein